MEKFYVRDAAKPRNYNFTFSDDGFYRTLKRKVADKLKEVDKAPIKISNLISDLVLGLVFTSAILSAKDDNVYLAGLAGVFLLWMLVAAHNFFHQKDNWRMLCFNLSLLNYREWRVSHAMSHHLYPNTYYDLEISMFEPFLQWIPRPKTTVQKIFSPILSPVVWTLLIIHTGIARLMISKYNDSKIIFFLHCRTIGYLTKREEFKWDHVIPLSIPIAMFYFGRPDFAIVIKLWLVMLTTCSFGVGVVGLNAGHHHPDVTHEGDEIG